MSVFSAFSRITRQLPNGRNNNSTSSSNDATEMTQIIDIDSILATADARHQIRSLTSSDDDISTISNDSDSTEYPVTAMSKRYYKDEDDDQIPYYAENDQDEARQRLVQSDLENGSEDAENTVSADRGKVRRQANTRDAE